MRYVENTLSLAPLCTRTYQNRHNVSREKLLELIRQLKNGMVHLHQQNILIVDLHALNFLVDQGFGTLYFIDVDSYQAPGFPATALLESIRDRHAPANQFNEGTDWFAFALLSFQLLIGIHPYKGKHPRLTTLDERMRANVSVLNPNVASPPSCFPFHRIPPTLRNWYVSVFEQGARHPPPDWSNSQLQLQPGQAKASNKKTMVRKLFSAQEPILHLASLLNQRTIVSKNHIWINGKERKNPCRSTNGVVFTGKTQRPVLAYQCNGKAAFYNLLNQEQIQFHGQLNQISIHHNRIFALQNGQLLELLFHDSGQKIAATSRRVSTCMRNASKLYPGVLLQNMLGATHISLLEEDGSCFQHHVNELDGLTILDSKYERGVLMVLYSSQGQTMRKVFRFDGARRNYVSGPAETGNGINFIVLERGIAITLNEDGSLHLFAVDPTLNSQKKVPNSGLSGHEVLASQAEDVLCIDSGHLYQIQLR